MKYGVQGLFLGGVFAYGNRAIQLAEVSVFTFQFS